MERIAEKLSEIEKTARAIVDNAQEQKHQMEMQMQKKSLIAALFIWW